MEIWLPNQEEAWNKAIASGQVVSLGESLGKDWQSAFVIPKYVADANPGLKTVEDLKKEEYMKLFETTGQPGQGPYRWAAWSAGPAKLSTTLKLWATA